jgi:hypothetical protein
MASSSPLSLTIDHRVLEPTFRFSDSARFTALPIVGFSRLPFLDAEGVTQHSPASRSARWVREESTRSKPRRGFTNAGR